MKLSNFDTLLTAPKVAEAISVGGREGTLSTADQPLDTTLGGGGANPEPELLFAGAYAACFHSAMIAVAERLGTPLVDSRLKARVGLLDDVDGGKRISVELHASAPGADPEELRNLMEQAHKGCPYSKALRGGAVVALVVD